MSGARADRRWDPDALAAREHERTTLLRELRELDAQLRSGEIAPAQHTALNDALTVRAAEVIAEIERGRAARPERRRRRGAIAAVSVTIGAAIVGAGWALTTQLAPRPPVDTFFTNAATVEERTARLASVVAERPDDVPARLAYARLLLQQQGIAAAAAQYDAAAALQPTNAEALAYGGWIAVLTGRDAEGRERLDRAVAADPAYADAHALRGLALRRAGDDGAAAEELRRYVELAPDGPMTAQVRSVLEQIGAAP